MVIIDSCVWIDALRRRGDLTTKVSLESLLAVFEAQICSHIRLEVLSGARAQDRALLSEHFSTLPNRTIEESDWARATELSWQMRDAGVDFPWNNLLTAAIAIHDKSRIYSFDSDLHELARVDPRVGLYRPGYGGAYTPDPSNP